jgi:hypothetical protein
MLNRFLIWIKKESVIAFFVCFSLLALALIVQISSSNLMQSESVGILAPLDSVDALKTEVLMDLLPDSNSRAEILKKQYSVSNQVKVFYKGVSIYYYKSYYAFSICSIIFTTLLTLSVFLMAHKGWSSSGIILKTFLLTNIVLSSIYYFLPNVLKNEENLTSNIEKAAKMEQIQSDMLVVATRFNSLENEEIDSAIASFHKSISENIEFKISIDNSRIQNDQTDLMDRLNSE